MDSPNCSTARVGEGKESFGLIVLNTPSSDLGIELARGPYAYGPLARPNLVEIEKFLQVPE